jgi:hypothetical protein
MNFETVSGTDLEVCALVGVGYHPGRRGNHPGTAKNQQQDQKRLPRMKTRAITSMKMPAITRMKMPTLTSMKMPANTSMKMPSNIGWVHCELPSRPASSTILPLCRAPTEDSPVPRHSATAEEKSFVTRARLHRLRKNSIWAGYLEVL